MRYELLAARRDPRARAVRAAMLARYPGLSFRAEEVDHGEGQIAQWRKSFGADKTWIKPPTTRPCVP